LLLENINAIDMPGYLLDTPTRAAELVAVIDSSRIQMQLEQYPAGTMKLDARAELKAHRDRIRHMQTADVPGCHQPGTGAQPIQDFLSDRDVLGFGGAVGLEYKPQGTTEEGLAWLPREARG
jgi:hydroxypyruvate isomerase